MPNNDLTTFPQQHLSYDFRYEGRRHKGRILLDECTSGLDSLFFEHDLEVTWVKRIRHKGKRIILNIVVNDDANKPEECGRLAASAWVCVYDPNDQRRIIDEFEPQRWAYTDEADMSHNVDQTSFYQS